MERPSLCVITMQMGVPVLFVAMEGVSKAIIFSPRYRHSAGVEGDDQVTAAAVAKYPDKFVGFAFLDPQRNDCMDMLRASIEELGLKGVKTDHMTGQGSTNPAFMKVQIRIRLSG